MVWMFRFFPTKQILWIFVFPTNINDLDFSQVGSIGEKWSPYLALQACCSGWLVSAPFYNDQASVILTSSIHTYVLSLRHLVGLTDSHASWIREPIACAILLFLFEALCAHRVQCSHEIRWPKGGWVQCGRMGWEFGVWTFRFPNKK